MLKELRRSIQTFYYGLLNGEQIRLEAVASPVSCSRVASTVGTTLYGYNVYKRLAIVWIPA
jgi:hypothetical protein